MSWCQQQSPDVGSDSLLSESAQLRSTLQAKTFLQALSPDDRRRLLKGTKLSGHRRKHHTSAVAAAAARRDELQQLLAEEKDRFIGEQAVLAQQADVSYSSRPAAHETAAWETARLRVRATSMAAENDALKHHVAQLMHQISNMDRSIQVVSNEARARSQRMTEAAAARIAELEDQLERQQRALGEMSAASEELAKDNCAVSDEVVQLREDRASQVHNMDALQDRVAKLQELYMRDLDQSKAITVHESIQQNNLLQLATPEMLAISQPPAEFPAAENMRPTRIVPALHEIEGLRRERHSLQEQVKTKAEKLAHAEQANAELNTQLSAERRAAKQAGAGAQKQLLGSMRRIQYMVTKAKEIDTSIQQKDAYIRKLETRLLTQHKVPVSKGKGGLENSKAGPGSLKRGNPSTASAVSKQNQPPVASSAVSAQGGSKRKETTPQPPMQSFSYQAFPQPFQDTSNLPSNLPFSHGQRPASAPPREPSAGHMPWQHDHPSGASSECFSMDPAQLEADIAALTSALTADSTAESLSGYPHPVKHARGYASHVTDHTGTPRQSQRYQEEHCSGMPAGREFTIPTRDLQTEHQHSWYDRHSPSRRADEPYASARAGPADGAAWSWSVHDQSTNMAGGESRGVEDAEASPEDEPIWHGRQSKDERLADAAECRLLGLAGRPKTAADSSQQDLEPRQHQPVSYVKPGMQDLGRSEANAMAAQQLRPGFEEDSIRVGGSKGPVTKPLPLAQEQRDVPVSAAGGREMLRAALHNLAMHNDSPPSSISPPSEPSALSAPSPLEPITSITANECFDGSALFANASSMSVAPAGAPADLTHDVYEPLHDRAAASRRLQLHQQLQGDAKALGRGVCDDRPERHTQLPSQVMSTKEQLQQESQQLHQHPVEQLQEPSHQVLQQVPKQLPPQMPAELPRQHPHPLPRQKLGQMHHQLPLAESGQLPDKPSNHAAPHPHQLTKAQHDSYPLASAAASRDDSGEDLMTMEELEARIASLNKTLLRAPKGSGSPRAASRHATPHSSGGQHHDHVQYQQPGLSGCRSHQAYRPETEACSPGAADKPALTAWQKLTGRHQAQAASASSGSSSSSSNRHSPGDAGARHRADHNSSPDRSQQKLRAVPLESPPSTGMRHYSAASKHRSEEWEGSDGRLLDWAASCPEGSPSQQNQQSDTSSDRIRQCGHRQRGRHPKPSAPTGGTPSFSADAGRPLTMLRSPAAVLPSRHLSRDTASSRQAMQARLSPVAASWKMYNSVHAGSSVTTEASSASS